MSDVLDEGPFFHGTKADLEVGDLLDAGLAAELAPGDAAPRVYVVEPTRAWEDDPNVTDRKFCRNPPGPTAAASRSGLSVRWTTGPGSRPRRSRRDRLVEIRDVESDEIIN